MKGGKGRLWQYLENLKDMKGGRWLVLGDFNSVTSQEEKINGRRVMNVETEDLRRFVQKTGLVDLDYCGCFFTWNNKHAEENRIWCKLDRVMCNTRWLDSYPRCKALFGPPDVSDHSPVSVSWGKKILQKKVQVLQLLGDLRWIF
ncbi:unnamed protein product [Rhodiola kirilowii]